MTSLSLFLDNVENGQYPTLAKEALSQSEKRGVTPEATLTSDGYCAILCSGAILAWSTKTTNSSSDKTHPVRAFKLELPPSGLHYSLRCFDTFHPSASHQHASAVIISPTGLLRYWPRVESASPPLDEQINLGGEVVHSLSNLGPLDGDNGPAQLFLITTTTEAFYTAAISSGDYSTVSVTRLHVRGTNSSSSLGIGRRVTAMLFGSGHDKVRDIVKVLPLGGQLRVLLGADACILTQSRARLLSLESSSIIAEIEVCEAVRTSLAASASEMSERALPVPKREERDLHEIRVVDADLLHNNILLLISCKGLDGDNTSMLLGLLRGRRKAASSGLSLISVVPMLLPERIYATGQEALDLTRLITVDENDCVVVFKDALLYIHSPTDPEKMPPSFMETFEDRLLGCGRTDGKCHLVFKRSGIHVVRELPVGFELDFWSRNQQWLEEEERGAANDEDFVIVESRINDAFMQFCRKDVHASKNIVERLNASGEEVIAEVVTRMTKKLLNRIPSNDPRWNSSSDARHDEDALRLLIASSKDFGLHVRQLSEKLTHLKMFLTFLQYCRVHEALGEGAVARIVELEEDALAALFFVKWLHQCHKSDEVKQFKLVTTCAEQAGEEWASRFGHTQNQCISAADHLFKEVTHFNEFLSQLVVAEKRKLEGEEEHADDVAQRALLVWEANASVVSTVEGIKRAGLEEASLAREGGEALSSKWGRVALEQLNIALDFLSGGVEEFAETEEEFHDAIIEQCTTIARFVLTLQQKVSMLGCRRMDNSPIISAFYSIGRRDIALMLAREHHDFTLLIKDCHEQMKGKERAAQLDAYRDDFKMHNFDLVLYDYYRLNGMVEQLLAEKDSQRLNHYLAAHEKINWIRNVEMGEYWSAERTLKSMAAKCDDQDRKMILLSLCKLCALCEDQENIEELAELSESIEALRTTHRYNG